VALHWQTLGAGVAGTGPAFSATITGTGQTINAATFTKLSFNSEQFDTNNNYDPTTNYRFTPTVAGYYQFTGRAQLVAAAGTGGEFFLALYKNNVSVMRGVSEPNVTGDIGTGVYGLMYLNGSTDYVEIFVYQSSGTSKQINTFGQEANYFQAAMVRAA
jgi:hypothetical protein